MKTIMAILMLLISASALADKPDCVTRWVPACEHSPPGLTKDTQGIAVDTVSVPEPSILTLIGLGVAALGLTRVVARKRKV
jgi:PEP-CTERM motif